MPPIAVSALWGEVNSDAAAFEQFSIGGGPSTILDRPQLAQRITMPVLPSGISTGSSVVTFRGAVGAAHVTLLLGGKHEHAQRPIPRLASRRRHRLDDVDWRDCARGYAGRARAVRCRRVAR